MLPEDVCKALCVGVGVVFIWQAGSLAARVKSKKARAVLHAAAGLTALFAGDLMGSLWGVGVGRGALTMGVSAVLGVPGVGLLWAVKYLL